MTAEKSKKDNDERLKTADESVRFIIENLLKEGNKYAVEYDGKSGCGVRLWSVVTLLSVYLERYMPAQVINEFVEKKQIVEEQEKQIKDSTTDPSKQTREINKMKYRVGIAGFEACVRVYVNSPLVTQNIKSMLDVQGITSVDGYSDIVERIHDEAHRVELFPKRVEDV